MAEIEDRRPTLSDPGPTELAQLETAVRIGLAQARLTLDDEAVRRVLHHVRQLQEHMAEFVDAPLSDGVEPAALLRL